MIPYSITPQNISFIVKGRPRTVSKSQPNFEAIKDAVIRGDVEKVLQLCDIKSFIAKISKGDVHITDNEVYYKTTKVSEYLAERILSLVNENLPIDSICKFTEKLMSNPSEDVKTDLFRWLEVGNMPLYPDGDFVAYKTVNNDFTPVHKGPYGQDQSVGKIVEMPRSECDDNRNNTCSKGLHFCSYDYLPQFGGFSTNRVTLVLKINPADVVSIPTDYNNTKGRTCRFEVVGTVPIEEIKERFGSSVVESYGTYQYTDDEYDSWGYEDVSYDDSWDDSWEDEVVTAVEQAVKYPNAPTMFVRDNSTFYTESIMSKVESLGISKAAESLGVPRSTLSGWVTKIKNS